MEATTRLYKYRCWNNTLHKRALTHNELYFASPADINDPFDFKITIDYSLLDTIEKRECYVDKLICDAYDILVERGINIALKKKELMWRLVNDRDRMQEEYNTTNFQWTDQRFGVISFSERWDSVLMWTHYSDNHKGFCIGYNREKFRSSNLFGLAGPVVYTDYYPQVNPLDPDLKNELLIKTHTKALDWKYEKEFRLTILWDEKNPSNEERILNVPDDFIEEVLLGMCVNDENKSEIVEIGKRKNIPIFMITKKPNSFLLEKIRL
jgi:hypothetical protein